MAAQNSVVIQALTRLRAGLALSLLLGFTGTLPAASLAALDIAELGTPAFRMFTEKSGLPQSTISAIALDADGYLWVGTGSGAAYYNGRVWRVVDMPNRTMSNFIRAILLAQDGSVWIGSEGGGVARLHKGAWTVFDTRSGLPSNKVRCLLETFDPVTKASVIWIGTEGAGLARLHEGRVSVFDKRSGLPDDRVICLLATGSAADGSEVLWAGTYGGGLARLSKGVVTVLDTQKGLPSNVVYALAAGSDAVWVGTEGGLARLKNEHITVHSVSSGALRENVVRAVLVTGSGADETVWIGTLGGGLTRLQRGVFVTFDMPSGRFPSDRVRNLFESRSEGGPATLWVGTEDGLVRVSPSSFIAVDKGSGLPNKTVRGFLETTAPGGQPIFWLATTSGLARFEDGRMHVHDVASGLPHRTTTALLETAAPEGGRALWVGTFGGGLGRLAKGTWTHYSAEAGIPDNKVTALLETESDASLDIVDTLSQPTRGSSPGAIPVSQGRTLWVATYGGGVARIEAGRARILDTTSGLPNNKVQAFLLTRAADGRRSLWMATFSGLVRLHGGHLTTLNTHAGLPNEQVLSLHESRAVDGRPALWVGTQGGGVTRFDPEAANPVFETLSDTTQPGLPSSTVYGVREDAHGRLYLFTSKGVARLTPRRAAPDSAFAYDAETFSTEDGLPSNQCTYGGSYVDSRGRIWAGTAEGAAFLDPAVDARDHMPKPVRIERVRVSGEDLPPSPPDAAGRELAHNRNHVSFEYALLNFSHEFETRYQTQLLGFEPDPTPWTAEFKREFTNLPPGGYTFRVFGRDAQGNVSRAEVPFRIRRAPWTTWWAWLLYIAAAGAIVDAGIRLRERAYRVRNDLLEEKVAERTRELAKKNEQLDRKNDELGRAVEQSRALEEETRRKSRDLVELIEKLRHQEKSAQEANRAKSVFLSNMSHELRTPLNAILGFVQLMERVQDRSPEDKEHLAILSRSGEHLLGLINDVLSISKIESGAVELEERAFSPARLFASLEEMFREKARARGLELTLDLDPGLPRHTLGDEGKLRQVLINLLGNAVKFTAKGGVRLAARWLADRPDSGRLDVAVSDTGPGIRPEEKDRLFELFVQTETGRKSREGTGLGLAISRGFVRLLGGDIAVSGVEERSREASTEHGTTFRFDVPLKVVREADSQPVSPANRRVIGLAPGQRAFRVLIADDSPEGRLLLVRLLMPLGFQIREASDGQEAVEAWSGFRPDVVLMDMRMPVLEGHEATREIRRREMRITGKGASKTAIIALTANAFEHDREMLYEAGGDDFIAKPFHEATLFQKLAEHVDMRFVYEEPTATRAPEPGRDARPAEFPTRERLQAILPETRQALREALIIGDDEGAAALVERIGARDADLGAQLRPLMRGLRFDELLELLDDTSEPSASREASRYHTPDV